MNRPQRSTAICPLRRLMLIGLVMLLFAAPVLMLRFQPVEAQTAEPTPTAAATDPAGQAEIPLVHVVQEGETLFSIAQSYETTVEILQQLNDIADPSLVYVGQELLIPGGGGDLVAAIHIVQVGDTLPGLAAGYDTTPEAIAAQNHLVNPEYLVAGLPLTIMSRTGTGAANSVNGAPYLVRPGDTFLGIAAAHGLAPAEIAAANDLAYPFYLYPGQRLRLPGPENFQHLDGAWQQVQLYPSPITQGQTAALYVAGLDAGQPAGRFGEQLLRFAPIEQGYLAFIALDAFVEPGRYRLEISGLSDQPFAQDVVVESGGYGTQLITVPEQLSPLLAPEIRAADEAILATIYEGFSEPAAWSGNFQEPIRDTLITAGYGDARSYNQGPIEIFHTGVDYAGPVGTPIYAPAAGAVVFSDTLNIQGNALILDHGLGVMTGYYHLSKVHVDVGQTITTGQLLAEGGSTGLSSGPHLHWDLRVGNVAVDGLQWLESDLIAAVLPAPAGSER
ncbi:MAG: LysM peptidoglycan-binding domain-containing protein [Chloroflexota bacterium]|nr:MAG: LysM peptidoglycan-binding domain-containing protein [Chloroflexota bacterium]